MNSNINLILECMGVAIELKWDKHFYILMNEQHAATMHNSWIQLMLLMIIGLAHECVSPTAISLF